MGFYFKLSNTCMVASTKELIKHKNPSKFIEIINAWFWVIMLITSLKLTIDYSVSTKSFAISWMTFIGGILLGFGAYINKACAVGTISKIGDGDFNYLFTPIGMMVSVFIFSHLYRESPEQINDTSIIILYPIYFWVISLIAVIFLLFYLSSKNKKKKFSNKILGSPTSIFSICFVFLLILKTPWSYTQVLVDISKSNFENVTENSILFVLFFTSSILAGLYLKTFKSTRFKLKSICTCFFGGAIIGWGSQLLMGSHDSITLYGFPLLLTGSVIAMLVNLTTIAACVKFKG